MQFISILLLITFSIVFAVIDFAILKVVGRWAYRLIFLINILIDFGVPFIRIWLLPQSGLPFVEQLPIFVDAWLTLWVNLFNFVLSSAIGFIVAVVLCMFTGDRPDYQW